MIKNPKFYLDVFSYLLKGVIDDRTKALHRQYLRNNNIVNDDYVDAGGYLHRPPIIIRKSLNGNAVYNHWDYNVGLTGNTTAFSKEVDGDGIGNTDDIIEWEYRLDEFTPLTVHNYQFNADGTANNQGLGFETGCNIDGVIINNCSLHDTDNVTTIPYLAMSKCIIELTFYGYGETVNPSFMAGVIDYDKSTNIQRVGNEIHTKGPGFVKIAFDKSLITIPIRTDSFSGIKIGVRPDYTSVPYSNWLYVGAVIPYMEYSMGNPRTYEEIIQSVNYRNIKAKNGSDYSMTTRNKNNNRTFYQGNIAYPSSAYGGGTGVATNGVPIHNGKRIWSLEFDEIMNFNTGDEENTGQLIPTNTDISTKPYSLSNIWKWDAVTDTENFITVDRTEDVLTNLFARTGGARLPFIFQSNSDVDDYSTAVLSDNSFQPQPASSASESLEVSIEEVYI